MRMPNNRRNRTSLTRRRFAGALGTEKMMKHMSKVTAGAIVAAMACLAPVFLHAREGLVASLQRFTVPAVVRPASQWALDLSKPTVLMVMALIVSAVLVVTELKAPSERARFLIQIALLLLLLVFSGFVLNCLVWLGNPIQN